MTIYFGNKDNAKDIITNVLDSNYKKDEEEIFRKIQRNANFTGIYNSQRVKTPTSRSRRFRTNLLDYESADQQ